MYLFSTLPIWKTSGQKESQSSYCVPFPAPTEDKVKLLITTAVMSPRKTEDSVDSELRGKKNQTGREIYRYCQRNLGCRVVIVGVSPDRY